MFTKGEKGGGCDYGSSTVRRAVFHRRERIVPIYINLFPKGEFLRTHRVGPLGLNGFLHLVLFFGIFHPYELWPLFSGWWVVGGAYFLVKF